MEVFWNGVTELATVYLWPLAQFLIGLGVVVFFHELGHFLAARWAGIRVERFALGMGPRLCGLKRGDTDYCICAVPLGGYVKMLGQEDFKPVAEGDTIDPHSFQAVSIGKRLVVISAGVVMNVILAGLLFVILCLVGKPFPAPVVGDVAETYPAAKVKIVWEIPPDAKDLTPPDSIGIQPGDRILTLNGRAVPRFIDVALKALLADKNASFDLTIARQKDGRTWIGKTRLAVQYSPADGVNQFGITFASTLVVDESDGISFQTPFRPGDRIVAINKQPIEHWWELAPRAKAIDGRPCTVTAERKDPKTGQHERIDIPQRPAVRTPANVSYLTDGSRLEAWVLDDATGRKEVTFQDLNGKALTLPRDRIAGGGLWELLDVLGLTPRLRVEGVVDGGIFSRSPAEQAGVKPGDVILSYGDRALPTWEQFQAISSDVGENETRLVVARDGKTLNLPIRPKIQKTKGQKRTIVGLILGCDLEHLVVARVRPGSTAAKAGIEPETVLTAVNGRSVADWQDLLRALREFQGQEIVLTGRLGATEKTWTLGVLSEKDFRPGDYSWTLLADVPFEPMMVTIVYRNPLKAMVWGAEETMRMVLSAYGTLGAIIRGSVSAGKAISGPVGIAKHAMGAARESFASLVYLMAILSTALAVFNFLPIPVLDGGHALLLLIEKVRRKPLPLKFVNIIQMIFLFLILGLFLLITWNDIFG